MRRLLLLVLLVLAAGLGYWVATRPSPRQPGAYQGDGMVRIPHAEPRDNDVGLASRRVKLPPGDPVEGALKALFAQKDEGDHRNPIPEGTRLLSLRVDGGIATLDVSEEFNHVKQHGTTGESLAQNALRQTLAQFPQIDRMLVTVNGKSFESEHTDWSEPIPVREANAGVGGDR